MDDMDVDLGDVYEPNIGVSEIGAESLRNFCRKATTQFFEEYGLISHQFNSYNHFIKHGLQKAFDSFGDLVIDPGYDPSKEGDAEWCYVLVKFGKVTLDQPSFFCDTEEKPMHPSHWGRVCFLPTPDGENCELVKNLASTGLVSTDVLEPVIDKLFECWMEKLAEAIYTKFDKTDSLFGWGMGWSM